MKFCLLCLGPMTEECLAEGAPGEERAGVEVDGRVGAARADGPVCLLVLVERRGRRCANLQRKPP